VPEPLACVGEVPGVIDDDEDVELLMEELVDELDEPGELTISLGGVGDGEIDEEDDDEVDEDEDEDDEDKDDDDDDEDDDDDVDDDRDDGGGAAPVIVKLGLIFPESPNSATM